ncbi:MAG: DUF885 family protein [Pseudomonadota bacterium]
MATMINSPSSKPLKPVCRWCRMCAPPVWILITCTAAAACGGSSGKGAKGPAGDMPGGKAKAEFEEAAETFYHATFDFRPDLAAGMGFHEYDGKLPDNSPEAVAAELARLRGARDTFEAFDKHALPMQQRIERDILLSIIRDGLFYFEVLRLHVTSPMVPLGAYGLINYISRDYKPIDERAQSLIEIAEAAPAYLDRAMANLEKELPIQPQGISRHLSFLRPGARDRHTRSHARRKRRPAAVIRMVLE